MDPHEEQEQELEVLESIYPDELTKISPTNFTIKLSLDTPSDRKHSLLLHIKYPPTYPEVIPVIEITIPDPDSDEEDEGYDDSDDDEDEDGHKMIHLSEVTEFTRDDLREFTEKLKEEAELQIGMPSVFTLATQLKDDAEVKFESKLEQAQKQYDDELLAKEKEEQKKFNGTKVTLESWTKWRNNFREEMKFEQRAKDDYERIHKGKYTGREVFEKGLAGIETEDDLLDDVTDSVKKISV